MIKSRATRRKLCIIFHKLLQPIADRIFRQYSDVANERSWLPNETDICSKVANYVIGFAEVLVLVQRPCLQWWCTSFVGISKERTLGNAGPVRKSLPNNRKETVECLGLCGYAASAINVIFCCRIQFRWIREERSAQKMKDIMVTSFSKCSVIGG